MSFPKVTIAEWRAQVEKELGGASFEKALVRTTLEGIAVEPLYVDGPKTLGLNTQASAKLCLTWEDEAAQALWQDDRILVDGRLLAVASALPQHNEGADAADEIAIALGLAAEQLNAQSREFVIQVGVGRDTFGELCKLRALRVCLAKMRAAAGLSVPPLVHAVSSARTMSERDPWVNILRVTTQMFAAILGGADFVTPVAYDEGQSELGRRVARNTALVLREESGLGRVIDPAAGSYYLESLTDALAREAWRRFQTGNIDIDAAFQKRRERIVKRKDAIVGVSEFANLDEPAPPHRATNPHRDAEPFERLRDRADALSADKPAPSISLVMLGPAAEHRARVGFARGFFPVGGIRIADGAPVACICGSDERYATEAADAARQLKANGCKRVLVAGRPGAMEQTLRNAGVDDFIYVGCDVVAVLDKLLELA